MIAADRFVEGVSQADIARAFGVAHETGSDWYDRFVEGGKDTLRGARRAGRLPKVSTEGLARVEEALRAGPQANGFPTELWTLERVAEVIERTSGVHCHPGHVWRLLRQMGWSRQRLARQAAGRNDEAIEAWVDERWPREKKTPEPGTRRSSSRTGRGSA